MEKSDLLNILLENGLFAVVRIKDPEKLLASVDAVIEGGIKNIEITTTVPDAFCQIKELSKRYSSDVIIGAGTILDKDMTLKAVDAGAKFIVSPIFSMEVIDQCHKKNVAVMPGCFSPTEIYSAWKAGADIVKVFPATSLGPRYFKDIKAPFPYIKLMPTGGVSVSNIPDWVRAGADAIAVGSELFRSEILESRNYSVIKETAAKAVENFISSKKELVYH